MQNRKKQYLIVQNSDQAYMEFPGIISKGYKMPEDDTFLLWKMLTKETLDSVKWLPADITLIDKIKQNL